MVAILDFVAVSATTFTSSPVSAKMMLGTQETTIKTDRTKARILFAFIVSSPQVVMHSFCCHYFIALDRAGSD
jgi:hypothetical protein